MKWHTLIFITLTWALPVLGAGSHKYYEKDYQHAWCSANSGQAEVILADKTRVDCVTKTHAVEFDFAKKWGESIGQALYYSAMTGKKAGVVLIMENGEKDNKYLERLMKVADLHGITVWVMTDADMLTPNCKTFNKNR